MLFHIPFRRVFQTALAVLVVASASYTVAAPQGGRHGGGFGPPPARMGDRGRPQPDQRGMRSQRQEHLEQWMNRHSNLPLAQQQRALENEPGFRRLPPQIQQHLRDRLTQLNNMPPEQRRRIIEGNEAMEHMSPPERQQVLGAMRQLHALPQDRRHLVGRAFRDLRRMPPSQRQEMLNSEQFRGQFSPGERQTLSDLLVIAPYLPAPARSGEEPRPDR